MHIIQSLSESFRRELRQFDRDRVLPAWDGLVAKQQTMLESLGVPTMFQTIASGDREVSTCESVPLSLSQLMCETLCRGSSVSCL